MTLKEITEKINSLKGSIMAIVGVLGLSFGLHTWMSGYFVTKEHFDNSVTNIQTKIDEQVANKMNEQFLVLNKNINETEYNVLGSQIASIHIENKFDLTPLELDNITKLVRKHCMLGVKLGYMSKNTDCEEKVDKKLNNQ
jgi:hypothetical protein